MSIMDKASFKRHLEQLEKEREEYIARLSPESLEEYRRKESALNAGLNIKNNPSINSTDLEK